MFKRIAAASVWARNGVAAADWRYRGIFRFVLPATDTLFFWFGGVGVINGIGSVREAAGHEWQVWWSAGIAVSALCAAIGVAFPKQWVLELGGNIVLVALVFGYVALYLLRGLTDPNITALAGLIAILILLPVWRIGDLGFVAWQRGHEARVRR